jgi:hypothetical protein
MNRRQAPAGSRAPKLAVAGPVKIPSLRKVQPSNVNLISSVQPGAGWGGDDRQMANTMVTPGLGPQLDFHQAQQHMRQHTRPHLPSQDTQPPFAQFLSSGRQGGSLSAEGLGSRRHAWAGHDSAPPQSRDYPMLASDHSSDRTYGQSRDMLGRGANHQQRPGREHEFRAPADHGGNQVDQGRGYPVRGNSTVAGAEDDRGQQKDFMKQRFIAKQKEREDREARLRKEQEERCAARLAELDLKAKRDADKREGQAREQPRDDSGPAIDETAPSTPEPNLQPENRHESRQLAPAPFSDGDPRCSSAEPLSYTKSGDVAGMPLESYQGANDAGAPQFSQFGQLAHFQQEGQGGNSWQQPPPTARHGMPMAIDSLNAQLQASQAVRTAQEATVHSEFNRTHQQPQLSPDVEQAQHILTNDKRPGPQNAWARPPAGKLIDPWKEEEEERRQQQRQQRQQQQQLKKQPPQHKQPKHSKHSKQQQPQPSATPSQSQKQQPLLPPPPEQQPQQQRRRKQQQKKQQQEELEQHRQRQQPQQQPKQRQKQRQRQTKTKAPNSSGGTQAGGRNDGSNKKKVDSRAHEKFTLAQDSNGSKRDKEKTRRNAAVQHHRKGEFAENRGADPVESVSAGDKGSTGSGSAGGDTESGAKPRGRRERGSRGKGSRRRKDAAQNDGNGQQQSDTSKGRQQPRTNQSEEAKHMSIEQNNSQLAPGASRAPANRGRSRGGQNHVGNTGGSDTAASTDTKVKGKRERSRGRGRGRSRGKSHGSNSGTESDRALRSALAPEGRVTLDTATGRSAPTVAVAFPAAGLSCTNPTPVPASMQIHWSQPSPSSSPQSAPSSSAAFTPFAAPFKLDAGN